MFGRFISAGTAAAECPEGVEPPAGEAPAAQISQRAPLASPQGRGRLTRRDYRVDPGRRNWLIETAVWIWPSFFHCALETR
eukprot:SAG31_NODE_4373_length_3298_cov_7.558299_3_plen_81_part_00